MPPPRSTWKAFERFIAGIFGWRRNSLSGRNNRHDDGTRTVGDVRTVPEYRNLNIECKHKAKWALHTLFHTIQSEAPEKTLFLFTHVLREPYEDSLVTMDAKTFRKMWFYAKEHFKDGAPDPPAG